MNRTEFIKIRQELLEACADIMDSKNEDYTKGNQMQGDFLHFFNTGIDIGVPPAQTCGLLLKKQISAVYNYIKSEGQSESEPISERIKDAINYLIFLHALIIQNESDKQRKR